MAKVPNSAINRASQEDGESRASRPPGSRKVRGGQSRPIGSSKEQRPAGARDIDHFIKTAGLDTRREKEIGSTSAIATMSTWCRTITGSRPSSGSTWK